VTDPPQSPERYEQFLTLFTQHRERLFGYVFALMPNYQDAEDVFQKTSIVLWRKFEEVRPDGDFFAWACKVAYYEVRNFRRTHARDRLFFSDEVLATLADERTLAADSISRRTAALQQCMQGLSPPHRELVQKAYAGHRSVGQLAEDLGRAVQTVYNRLYRIRRLLFDCVEQRLTSEEAS
jgi:RNA polymerase sigma-70 factor (ECF subfamily)